MADVTLRDSLDLMRSFLRSGHLAEAFALGRHILQFYPKHIETYTVLAQVSLATNDIAGANDLLRRVLSSDPENVIALAGMALISEAQDKQDEALWYLERAYEIQPSNDELRGELLRLREEFYGIAPARVELTPGALARVYARQGQYAQAANEYRRLLRNESQRYDAQVGLAETLYRAGRTDEAAQLAQSVMADAPYALKPNLILGALWSENAVPEGQQFLQRAHQLDPEHRVARDLLGERYDGTEPPRLPEMRETSAAPVALPPPVEPQPAEAYPRSRDTARAALLLSEIERAHESERVTQEPLIGDPAALDRVGRAPNAPEDSTLETTAKIAAGALVLNLVAEALKPADKPNADAAPVPSDSVAVVAAASVPVTSDSTLDEIASAERIKAEQEKPAAAPLAEKSGHSKSDGVSTEVIAAAAAALATSIALDKSNQPAPTRRTHSAIPKVRPVIPGNNEKLPSWLYLSATPANANASFDALPDSTADQVASVPTEPDRPDWLVQAEAASESEPVNVNTQDGLPDWLMPAAVVGAAAAVVSEQTKSSETIAVPTDESKIESGATDENVRAQASAAPLPEWLRDPHSTSEPTTPVQEQLVARAVSPDDTLPLEHPPLSEAMASIADKQRSEPEFNAALPLAAVAAAAIIADRPTDEPAPPAVADTPVIAEPVVVSAAPIAEEPLASEAESDTVPGALTGKPSAVETIAAPAVVAAALIADSTVNETPQLKTVAAVAPLVGEPSVTETASPESAVAAPVAEERTQTQAQPDSATMLQMARDKRDSGDLKGALDLYERVMHRRPNHLDQVTADLEAIVGAGGAPLSANRLLGEAYAMIGRFKESLVQYRTALGK